MKILLFAALVVVALSILPFLSGPKSIDVLNGSLSSTVTTSTVASTSPDIVVATSSRPLTVATSSVSVTATSLVSQVATNPSTTLRTGTQTAVIQESTSTSPAVRSSLSSKEPFQGDTVVVSVFDKALIPRSAMFDGKTVSFFSYQDHVVSLLPISADKAPGTYFLDVVFQNGETMKRAIRVQKKSFPLVVLGIPKELGMTSGQLVANLQTEKTQLMKVLGVTAPETFFSDTFIAPLDVAPRITSEFGELRQTGENQIRHLGIDLAAPLGTPVHAMNSGVVRDAYADTIYGNSILLDHGQGIFSLYMHLDTMKTKKGDNISRGDVIGTVGKTGYSTAEHLHLSFKINGMSVDPLRFIESFK
ncbi:MAG: M23 family metallopeptidase [Candidatus Jorgensenbacteria bacterium]|nr:M23 family metallopeptidase [Candidatus Jorgensenbacteria bacterium]